MYQRKRRVSTVTFYGSDVGWEGVGFNIDSAYCMGNMGTRELTLESLEEAWGQHYPNFASKHEGFGDYWYQFRVYPNLLLSFPTDKDCNFPSQAAVKNSQCNIKMAILYHTM